MKGLCIASAMLLASSVSATATPRSDIVSLIERAASSSAVDVVSFDRYPEGRGIATTFMFVEDDIRYTFLYDAGFSLGTHGLVINIGPAVYQPGHFPEGDHPSRSETFEHFGDGGRRETELNIPS